MPRFYPIYSALVQIFLVITLSLSLQACSKTNPGIEVGNPSGTESLKGLIITINPEDNQEESYQVDLISGSEAVLTLLGAENNESLNINLENITNNSFSIAGTFSDGSLVSIEINFTDSTVTINQVDLFVDEVLVSSSFSVAGNIITCNTGTNNAAEQLSQSICNRIVACTSTITCADCATGIGNSDQLTDELGLPFADGSITFNEIITQVEDGTLVAEASFLNTCLQDIGNLTCNQIDDGFNEGDPTNYQNIEIFMPEEEPTIACPQVF